MNSNQKRILITGGSGFIGTNAVEYFLNNYFKVLSLDINAPQNSNHNNLWLKCNILDLERYKQLSNDFSPHYFLHLAARTDLNGKNLIDYAVNIEGVKNTIEVINSCQNIRRVIFASSRMVCKINYQPKSPNDYCPPNLYGKSKVIGENIVKASNINCEWIIIRPTSIWGPWFEVPYKDFFLIIQKRLFFYAGSYNPEKSFGFIGNTVYQIGKLFQVDKTLVNKKLFYICDYPPLKLREWADLIRKEMNLNSIPTIPYSIFKTIAFLGDLFHLLGWYRVPLTTFRLNNIITNMTYDTEELKNICSDLPYSLDEGVKQTIKWMKNHN